MNARYIDVREHAKIIRQIFKRMFPSTTFSVRTDRFAGGAAINISYVDGPPLEAVEQVVGMFDGIRHDGMTGNAYSVHHWLYPDGSTEVATYHEAEECSGVERELVNFGCYMSVQRQFTAGFLQPFVTKWNATHADYEALAIDEYDGYAVWVLADAKLHPEGELGWLAAKRFAKEEFRKYDESCEGARRS